MEKGCSSFSVSTSKMRNKLASGWMAQAVMAPAHQTRGRKISQGIRSDLRNVTSAVPAPSFCFAFLLFYEMNRLRGSGQDRAHSPN